MKNRKLHVSDDALRFIEHFEGYYATPYNDPANHATVGIGHLLHYGPVTQADRNKWNLSKREALDLLKKDIVKYEDAVKRNITVKLKQHEFDALVSFVYNLGEGAVRPSQSTLARLLNAGDKEGAAEQFVRWNKAGGVVLAGLTRRRLSERDLFLNADYTPRAS